MWILFTIKKIKNISKIINYTLSWEAGYEYRFTFPKSSAVASSSSSLLRAQEFISVPSAPSGQMPIELKAKTQLWVAHCTSRKLLELVTWRQTLGFP